jgi:hypothetical protein
MAEKYKVGQLIHYGGSVFKVVKFDHGVPVLEETKVLVNFD